MFEFCHHVRYLSRCALVANRPFLMNDFNGLTSYSKRTVFILKRRNNVKMPKYGQTEVRLKGKDYVYDLVENTELKPQPEIPVILKQLVEGVGMEGDVVHMPRNRAYNQLLVTGLADYATPEMIEASKTRKNAGDVVSASSSPFAVYTMKKLERTVVNIVMNKDTPWTIQPWHVRVAFRKAAIHVPEYAIKLPDKPISGPDLSLEQKDFIAVITINGREKANVRCRIHHWATDPSERLPYIKYPCSIKTAAIFEEEESLLDQLPLLSVPEKKLF